MNRKVLTVLLVIAMVFALAPVALAASTFSDIAGHWAEKDINAAVSSGYVQGYSDGTFKPDANITRAEFVAMVNNALGTSEVSSTLFTDVTKSNWYYSDVQKAVFACYVNGYEDNTFRPNNLISRAEAAAIISRIVPTTDNLESDALKGFTDRSSIADWAEDAAGSIADKGYINGYPDGTFRPSGKLTRAEAVSIINRILNNETIITKKTILKADEDSINYGIYVGGIEIASSVGDGSVTIDDSMILSTMQILGGGSDTVEVKDSFVAVMNSNKEGDEPVRIQMVGNTTIQELNIFQDTILDEDDLTGAGVVNAYIDGDDVSEVEVSGTIANLTVSKACKIVVKDGGSIESITVNVKGVIIEVEDGGYVGTVITNGSTKLRGPEAIQHLIVNNGSNDTYVTEPEKITINDGTAKEETTSTSSSGGSSSHTSTTKIAAPTGFVLTNTDGEYTFSWTNDTDVDSYSVIIAKADGTVLAPTATVIRDTEAGTASIDLDLALATYLASTDADAGANLTVTVTAVPVSTSKTSNTGSKTLQLLARPDPSLDSDTATLSWDAVTNATEYQLAVDSVLQDTISITDSLDAAIGAYLTNTDQEYAFQLTAVGDATNFHISNAWSKTIVRLSGNAIANLALTQIGDDYYMTWDNVTGNNGYTLSTNIAGDSAVDIAKDVTSYLIPDSWFNKNMNIIVTVDAKDFTTNTWTVGGNIDSATHGVNGPAAPSPYSTGTIANPFLVSWEEVTLATNGYQVQINDTLVTDLDQKITSGTVEGKTIYTVDLEDDFDALPEGNYTVSIRATARLTGTEDFILPSEWATATEAAGSEETQAYQIVKLDAINAFVIDQSGANDKLQWGAITSGTVDEETAPVTGITVDIDYDLSLVDPASGTFDPATDIVVEETAEHLFNPNLDGDTAVYVRATSEDPFMRSSDWVFVTLSRLAQPSLTLAQEPDPEDYDTLTEFGNQNSVNLTLGIVTNATSYALKKDTTLLTDTAPDTVDITADFQLEAGNTVQYNYQAFGTPYGTSVGAEGILYLNSFLKTQDITRLAAPSGIAITRDYTNVVEPFDTDNTKLGSADRDYIVNWNQITDNNGYLVKANDLSADVTLSQDGNLWTLPNTWRDTLKSYDNILVAAVGDVDDFILSSYPTMISGTPSTQTLYTKPVLSAPTATGYVVNLPLHSEVTLYDIMVTYTDDLGTTTDVTPSGAQGIDKTLQTTVDLTSVINSDNGTYNVYARSADVITGGSVSVIGSTWSAPLTITNNRLMAPAMSLSTSINPTTLAETVTLNWVESLLNTDGGTKSYVVTVDGAAQALTGNTSMDITALVAGKTSFDISIDESTDTIGWLDAEPVTQAVTRRATPAVSVADNGSTIVSIAGSDASVDNGDVDSYYLTGGATFIDGTDKITSDVTSTFNTPNDTSVTYAAVVKGDDATFVLPSAIGSLTVRRLPIPSDVTLAGTYDNYSVAWNNGSPSAAGFKVFLNSNSTPAKTTAADVFSVAANGTWMPINDSTNSVQVQALGDVTTGVLDSQKSANLLITCPKAPTNVALSSLGVLTWNGLDGTKYEVVGITKDGNAITDYEGLTLSSLYTTSYNGSVDLSAIMEANGTGLYGVTMRACENLIPATKIMGSVTTAPATQTIHVATAPTLSGITQSSNPAPGSVEFLLPTDDYTDSFTVTVTPPGAPTGTITIPATPPSTALPLDLGTYFGTPGIYTIDITPNALPSALDGDPFAFTVEKLTTPTVEIRNASVHLYWPAANLTDDANYYTVINTNDPAATYTVLACGVDLTPGIGYFQVDITDDCVAGETPEYTVSRTGGTDDPDATVNFTLSADGVLKQVIRLADVDAASFVITETTEADCSQSYTLSWDAVAEALGYAKVESSTETAVTLPYALAPVAGSSATLSVIATGSTDSSDSPYYVKSATPTTVTMSALGAIMEAELNGTTANWTPQGAGQQFQFRILKLDSATSTDVTAALGSSLPQNTTLTSKDLSTTINNILANGDPDSSYAIQVRSKGNLVAASGALVIPGPWKTIKGASDLVTVDTADEWDVTFTVVDGNGDPINGAYVAISLAGTTYDGTAAVDSNAVTLNLPGGTYDVGEVVLSATADDYENFTESNSASINIGADFASAGVEIAMDLSAVAYDFTVTGEAEDDTVGDIIITTADGLTTIDSVSIASKAASIDLLPGDYAYTLDATYGSSYPYESVSSTPFTVVRESAKTVDPPSDNADTISLTKITYDATFVFYGSADSPVKDVTFSLTGPTTVSGQLVTSTVNHVTLALLPGSYDLSASKAGYDVYTSTFSVPDTSLIESDLALLDSSDIQFTVQSGALNLTGATVNIFNATDDVATVIPVKTLTTTDGIATCSDILPYGDYQYVVTAGSDYLEETGTFTLTDSSVIRETVALKLPVSITVKSGITDTIEGAAFTVLTGDDTPVYDGISKTYQVNLEAGTYTDVQVSVGSYTAQLQTLNIADGGILDYTYDMTSTATIVSKKSAALFPGVIIAVTGNGSTQTGTTAGATASVDFELTDGSYGYTAQYPGLAAVVDQPITFTVANGSVAASDLSKLTVIMFEDTSATFGVNFGVTVDGAAAASGSISVDGGAAVNLDASGEALFSLTAGTHTYTVTYGGNAVVASQSFSVSASSTTLQVPVALYTVSLNLVDGSSNPATNLDDVTVTLGSFTASRTPVDGNTYEVVVAGDTAYNYTITDAAASDKYATLNLTTPVISAAADIDVLMAKQTYDVTFTITDGTGDGLGGALITVYTDDSGSTVYGTYTTNSAGQYVVSGVAPTNYWFKVTKDGYEASAITAFTVANNDTDVDLALTETANKTVEFTVNSGDVTMMKNVDITIKKAGTTLETINTTSTGIAIKNLLLGDYTYSVSVAGYTAIADQSFTVTDSTSLVPITLTIPVTIAVTSGDTEIAGAVFQNGGVTLTPTDFDAATGKYSFEMEAGTYTLDVTKTNYNANQVALDVNSTDDQTAYAVTMTSNATFHATYDGNALGGVEIKNGATTIATTADGTGLATAALVDGSYTVTAVKTYYVSSNATSYSVTIANGVASPATTEIIMSAQVGALLPTIFTVNLDGGDPAAGEAVFEISTVGGTAQPNATITSGNTVTTNLLAGAYNYTLKYAGNTVKTGSFDVVAITGATVPAISLNTLDFHATDALSSADIANANINVGGLDIQTAADGTASIVLATAASYSFTATHADYVDVTQTGSSPFNFTMATKTYSAIFNVHKDSLSGDGLTGATIKVYSNSGLTTQVGSDLTTSGLGSATLSSLAPGQYWYTIEKTGYTTTYNSSTPGTFTIASANQTVEAYLTTIIPATTYQITFSIGGGVTGNVYAGHDSTSGTALNTSAVGNTNVVQLAAGDYTFYAAAQNGYEEVIQNFTVVDAGFTVTVELTVPYEVTVTSGSTAINGATVTLGGEAPVSVSGNIYNFSVEEGASTLSVTKSSYTAQTAIAVNPSAGIETGTTVNLVAPISFDAMDADSNALSGVLFTLTKGGVDYTGTTGVDGSATISLEDGIYSLLATKTGYVPVTMINVTVTGGILTSDPVTAVMVVNTNTLYNVTFHISSAIAANVDITVDGTAYATITAGSTESTPTLSLVAGTHSLSAVATGYTVTPSSFSVAVSSDPLTVDLTLTPVPEPDTQSVIFTVTSGSTSISSATISLTPTGASGSATTLANISGTGSYLNQYVEYGEYNYTVTASGYPTATGTITVDGDPDPLSVAVSLDISYSVLVESGGNPVSGASVTLDSTTVSTDANGIAEFSIAAGSYTLSVTKSPYTAQSGITVNPSTSETSTTINLVAPISFNAIDAGSSALSGVLFTLTKGGVNYTGTTGVTGIASITLADGTYSLLATKTGYVPVSYINVIVSGGVLTSDPVTAVMVVNNGTLYEVTFNISSAIAANVDITVDGTPSATITAGSTTSTPTLSLTSGTHSLSAAATGYTVTPTSFTVPVSSDPLAVDLTLTPVPAPDTQSVVFIVTSGSTAISSASISLTPTGASGSATTLTNISGTSAYLNEDVEYGEYTYTVTASGYPAATGTITVDGTSIPLSVAVSLEIPYSILVTSGGNPVSGASVTLDGNTETTGSDGVAEFSVLDGTYDVLVSKTGYTSASISDLAITSSGTTPITLVSDNIVMLFVESIESVLTPLEGVEVTVTGVSGTYTTNVDGEISIDGLEDGDYSYTAMKDNYTTSTGSFEVDAGNTDLPAEGIVMSMDPFGEYDVTFVINLDGSPVADPDTIPVVIDGDTNNLSSGNTVALSLNNHSYYVEATSEYEATGTHYFSVSGEGQTVTINLASPSTIDLTITVKDATNSTGDYTVLLNGATVEITCGSTTLSDTTTNGIVTFTGISATDDITYTVSKTGYNSGSGTLTAGTTAATVELTEEVVVVTSRTFNFALSQSDIGATIDILGVNDNSSFATTVNVGGNSASVTLADGDYIYYYTSGNGYTVTPSGWNDILVSASSTTENITLTTP